MKPTRAFRIACAISLLALASACNGDDIEAASGAAAPTAPATDQEVADQAGEVRALVERFVEQFQRNAFRSAANLFHMDPSFDATARERETAKIAALLSAFSQHHGPLQKTGQGSLEGKTNNLVVRAGQNAYWDGLEPEASATTALESRFSAGRVVIYLGLMRTGTKWEFAQVAFGVSATDAEATARLESVREAAARFLAGG